MYVFIRQDLSVKHQLIQSNHASFQLAALSGPYDGIPNLILIGVPNVRTLLRTAAKLKAAQLPHYEYREPDISADNDANFTSIATAPLDAEQRKVLENYRLYNESNNARVVERSVSDESLNAPQSAGRSIDARAPISV